MVEYILGVALIALLVIGGIRFLGKKTHNAFVDAGQKLEQEMTNAQTSGNQERSIR